MIEYGKLSYRELEDYSNMQAAQIRKKNNQIEQLQARVKELETALKKQAKAALSGMDAARAEGALRMEIAERLNAESRPELIESEREANAILTAEVKRLCQARDQQRDGRLAALERAAKAESDVAGLVEALELARIDLKEWLKSFPNASREPTVKNIERIDAVLAAHRKQGDSND